MSKKTFYILAMLAVLTVGLFIERYGYNTYKYHTPVPDCNKVMSVKACSEYGAWERNYIYLHQKNTFNHPTTFQYTGSWIHTMIYGLFFAINGSFSGFLAKPPLPVPEWTAVSVAIVGSLSLIIFSKKIFSKNEINKLLLFIVLIYIAILWLQNYEEYEHFGKPVAVQGRYLIPILIPIYILIGQSFTQLLHRKSRLKVSFACGATLLFLLGGGMLTFVIRSDSSWYNDNTKVIKINQTLHNILVPIIPGSSLG